MSAAESVPEKIVKRKTIVYRTLVDPTVAKITGEKNKARLFVRLGFLKPKPEEVQCVSVDKSYEPYLVVRGKYSIDYYRKRIYTVEVDADVQEVILLKRSFKTVSPEKPAKKGYRVIRLVGEERLLYEDATYLILDKVGREVAPDQVPEAPSEEESEKTLTEFREKIGKLEIPADMEVGIIRSKIVKRPQEIARVVEEIFEISERAIIYAPIYEVGFQNTKTGGIRTVRVDGITAKVIQ
ncbi:MAG: hypothetical protein JSV57_03455 [Candidatus Bathyarchaeota archaeon]|nr:MAG: hypothetical protein JSV57_03455 [Candidatus Bathyarchaeota archaeon]